MDQDKSATSSTLESPINKSLNPLDNHEIQESFYRPCKHLFQRLEGLEESFVDCYVFEKMLQEAVECVNFLIKKPDMIQEMGQRSYSAVDANEFASFCAVVSESISEMRKKASDALIPQFPSMPSSKKYASTLCSRQKKASMKSISKLQDIFTENFTKIGLGRLDHISSWLCYAVVRFLGAINEILFLKLVEDDHLFFKSKANEILEAMEHNFKEELLNTLEHLKRRKSC